MKEHGGKTLVGVDLETLAEKLREADMLLILLTDGYIESMKDPHDIEHIAINLQLQEAAKGEKEVYLICFRPIQKKNFSLLMDMLEGSKLKNILFIDKGDERDLDRASRLVGLLMGPARISGTSGDAWLLGDKT